MLAHTNQSDRMERQMLEPNTILVMQRCFNLVARAAIVGLTWACLLGIAFSLNWFINIVLSSLNADDAIRTILSQIILAFVVVLGVCATITGFMDVISLTAAVVRSAFANPSNSGQSDSSDER